MPTILPDIPTVETAIVEMTNTYRAGHKLSPVGPSPALTAAARAFADFLARTDSFAHDAGGTTLQQRAGNAGYDYCEISENLARSLDSRGFESRKLAESTVEGWINSPGHRRNIEAPNVTETGVAVARVPDKHPKFVVVQLFGRPRSFAFDVQIANTTQSTVIYSFGDQSHELAPSMAATHTTCAPTSVVFKKAGTGAGAVALTARYEATTGAVYVIERGKRGTPQVKVETRRKIK